MELPQAGSVGVSTQVSQEQDELTQRLARLRQAEWYCPLNFKNFALLSFIIFTKSSNNFIPFYI